MIGVGNVVAMPITCHMNVMFENSLAPHVRFSGADDIFLEIAFLCNLPNLGYRCCCFSKMNGVSLYLNTSKK